MRLHINIIQYWRLTFDIEGWRDVYFYEINFCLLCYDCDIYQYWRLTFDIGGRRGL